MPDPDLSHRLISAADALARRAAEVASLCRRLPLDTPRRVLESGERGLLVYLEGLATPEPPPAAPGTTIH